jgi:flagellar basal body-associated protein FliL
MYCLYCGSTIANDAQFCESCGKKQNVVDASPAPPSIQQTVAPKMRSKATIWVLMIIVIVVLAIAWSLHSPDNSTSQQEQHQPATTPSRDDEFEKRVSELLNVWQQSGANLSREDAERSVRASMQNEAEAQAAKEPAQIQPPAYRVYKSKNDMIAYIVATRATDEQLKNLLWLFRRKVRAGAFGDIGIRKPTSKTGMLLVYRGEKCANEEFISEEQLEKGYSGPCGEAEHDDAYYQWGIRPTGFFDEGGLRAKDGDVVLVFQDNGNPE